MRRASAVLLCLLAPLVGVLAWVRLVSRGPEAAAFALLLAAALAMAAALWLALRTWRPAVAFTVPALSALVALLAGHGGDALPTPSAFVGDLPAASPPATMRVFRIDTGIAHRSAAFAYRGGSPFDARTFTMSAVLVQHPDGDLLIDAGLSRTVFDQLEAMPWWMRAATALERTRSVAEQLDAIGYDRARLRAVILTHAHWDHVSGLAELTDTPVWITAAERVHIASGGVIMRLTRELGAIAFVEYGFDDGPYLGSR